MTGVDWRSRLLRRAVGALVVITSGWLLAACDPGGRLAQLTPQPVATPFVLGVTTEATAPIASADAPPTPETPEPTPAYDPALPEWTILYFASADNDRSSYVLENLNEFELGASSDRIQVVAQVDWGPQSAVDTQEGARYRIVPDADPQRFTATPAELLGELNMGEPATLADFLLWAVTSYPANRYALILDGYGGGWNGCCLDNAVGPAREKDYLSLNNLDQALAIAHAATGGVRWDIVAFGASLMSQVDVLQVVGNYADYAVASPGLVPGPSWDFAAVLAVLNDKPNVEARDLAAALVSQFMAYQQEQSEDYVSMTAVDLAKMPDVSAAVEALAFALAADPDLADGMAVDARRGAQVYGEAAVSAADKLAAVDLLHAAAILYEVSESGDIQATASAVTNALNQAIVAHESGPGLANARGVAIYWPTAPEQLNQRYFQVTRLPIWAGFLANFISASATRVPPLVALEAAPRAATSITDPALLATKVIGRNIESLAVVAAQEAADGRRVLRQFQSVEPSPVTLPAGTTTSMWPDGYHESLLVWDPIGGYLADVSGSGDYVAMQTADSSPVGAQVVAKGYFRHGDSERLTTADLAFSPATAVPRHLWVTDTVSNDGLLVSEVAPTAGDIFQPATLFIDSGGYVSSEPGVTLAFGDYQSIVRSTRPLPGGNFDVGMRAVALGSSPAVSKVAVTVDAPAESVTYRAFVDAAHGVQFPYPVSWPPPTVENDVAHTSDGSGQAQLQVRFYPNWTADLEALQSQILNTFGDVSILWQEPALVGTTEPVEAQRTSYGYRNADGAERTGVFTTFVHNGVGYVIDIDGPRQAEEDTLALMDAITADWRFIGPRLGFGNDPWSTLDIGNIRVDYPAEYAFQTFNNWNRFAADPRTFVAVRVQPAGRTPAEAMAGLLQTAAEGVAGFEADEPQRYYYAGHVWQRNDFRYVDPSGTEIRGLLLSRLEANQEIAVWGEAPAESAEIQFEQVFLPTAATIRLTPAPPAG